MTAMEQHAIMKSMESDLRNYKIQQVEGWYMGHKEVSFMVSKVELLNPLLALATLYNQDSIMVVSSYGGAALVSTNEDVFAEFIGEFKVSKTKPEYGDYSYNPRTLDYYTVEDIT
jgi:Mg2+/Co2+ transporter CorB